MPGAPSTWRFALTVRDLVSIGTVIAIATGMYFANKAELQTFRSDMRRQQEIAESQTRTLQTLNDTIAALHDSITDLRGELRGKGLIGSGK